MDELATTFAALCTQYMFSFQTFLGIIHESENDADGILAIIRDLHTYVPFHGEDEKRVYGDLGVVGDQLSVETGVNGHNSLSNGFTPEQRAEGLHFEIADWHAGNKFLEVSKKNNLSSSKYNSERFCS